MVLDDEFIHASERGRLGDYRFSKSFQLFYISIYLDIYAGGGVSHPTHQVKTLCKSENEWAKADPLYDPGYVDVRTNKFIHNCSYAGSAYFAAAIAKKNHIK
jgi:predicted  nucleic acid-binding Zn ribbon protein